MVDVNIIHFIVFSTVTQHLYDNIFNKHTIVYFQFVEHKYTIPRNIFGVIYTIPRNLIILTLNLLCTVNHNNLKTSYQSIRFL